MRRKFSRSLSGYQPTDVDQTVKLLVEDHQSKLEQRRRDLAQVNERIDALRRGLSPVREELGLNRGQEQQLADDLLAAHLQACDRILQAVRESEQAEQTLRQQIMRQENQVMELQTQLAQLRQDIKSMAQRYAQAVTRVEGKD